jgi:uncharacterized protein (TIGR03437 family)
MKTFFPGVAALLLALVLAHPAQSQTITTVAGSSTWSPVFDVFVDSAGNIYVADPGNNAVYKVDRQGVTTTIAGVGGLKSGGFSGDGGPATSAKLVTPISVVVAPDGTVYISDTGNNRIRKIAPNGNISTYAGTGDRGSTGDGGPATSATLFNPRMLALDTQGNLYFVDYYRIRKISASGVITTVGGTGRTTLSPDGKLATATDMVPGWIKVAADGTIYYTDDGIDGIDGSQRVRKIAPNGIVSTVAGTGVGGFTGDGGPAISAQFGLVTGVAVDPAGNVYISDAGNHRIRKVSLDGIIKTYAGNGTGGLQIGDGGPAVNATVQPWGLALDSGNNLYVADSGIRIRKISPPPVPTISFTNAVVPSFIGKADFGSNMYVELYGSNLSATSRPWAGSDFNGSNAPTSLDGVSVAVNGKPAFVYYISPGQININTPEDTATGPVLIQVHNSLGFSNTGSANRARLSPTLQSVPQFVVGGKSYVVAQTPDFKNFIGTQGMVAGVPFVAAKPGDTVLIYALGCGPTNPATQAGVVAAQNSPLALPYQLNIGGAPAAVNFAGMVAGSIGLYQFNVVIPTVASGDQTIELIVDGVPNAQNLYIVIGN